MKKTTVTEMSYFEHDYPIICEYGTAGTHKQYRVLRRW
nr:MAG TPA: hypothetical protein [Caudoviricetes sp.]